jgi:Uma2 family endonuclease
MAMPIAERRWTAQMVRELPDDGNRYEVVDGVLLVTPAPALPHQAVLRELFLALHRYLEPLARQGTVFWSPADISWAPDVLVQPDLFVVTPEELSAEWATLRTLPLAVEVLSPSSRRADREAKRAIYQRYGVQTYWVVDHQAGTVEVWHPGDAAPQVVTDVLRWRVTKEAPELSIPLKEVWENLPGST